MSEEIRSERGQIAREVRQRLESLRRAGLDRIAAPRIPEAPRLATPAPPVVATRRPEERPRPAETPAPAPAVAAEPAPIEAPWRRVETPAPAPAPPPAGPTPSRSLFGESGFATPVVPAAERPALLEALAAEVAACTRCPHLASSRTQTVFADGTPTARLMFVGEAPGADEDRTGVPFVGRAGVLLTDMITKGMGLSRDEVYIANVLKSRPPGNRNPMPDEVAHCLPFLERQIEIVRPEFLCLLGKVAASALLETTLSLGRLRGRWHQYRGIPTIVTYHPSFLLREPAYKKDTWADLQMLMQAMGIRPPQRKAR